MNLEDVVSLIIDMEWDASYKKDWFGLFVQIILKEVTAVKVQLGRSFQISHLMH